MTKGTGEETIYLFFDNLQAEPQTNTCRLLIPSISIGISTSVSSLRSPAALPPGNGEHLQANRLQSSEPPPSPNPIKPYNPKPPFLSLDGSLELEPYELLKWPPLLYPLSKTHFHHPRSKSIHQGGILVAPKLEIPDRAAAVLSQSSPNGRYQFFCTKGFNLGKSNTGVAKSMVDKLLNAVTSAFLRYKEAVGLQMEAFWKRNYLILVGATGVVLCVTLWRVMFGISSTFVGLLEGMAISCFGSCNGFFC